MARPTVTEITENYTKRPVWAEIDLDRAAEICVKFAALPGRTAW